MNIGIFIKINNWRNRGLVHKTHEIVELEKYQISRVKNSSNLNRQRFYKISEVL